MTSVVMEHIILTSLMLIVIMIFPLTANYVVANYVNLQREVVAQGALNQLTSTVQQLGYTLSQEDISPCNVTMSGPLPQTIDSNTYHIFATTTDGGKNLTLSLFLPALDLQINKTIILSSNTVWKNSEYSSLSTASALNIEKFVNGTLLFSFI